MTEEETVGAPFNARADTLKPSSPHLLQRSTSSWTTGTSLDKPGGDGSWVQSERPEERDDEACDRPEDDVERQA
ncbi:MAG TPA: hypothetical protein VLR47_11750, partial [Rhodospirillales bacterium]|nr:hypothetical protein [Rhodospirillales bacterium]